MNQFQIATLIAIQAHAGQTRRGGEPYIKHPTRVAQALEGESDEIRAAAIEHDSVEDSNLTFEDLREKGLNARTIHLIKILTKQKGQNYHEYLRGFRGEKDARKIKKADIADNLNDNPTEKQKLKYALALRYLDFLDFLEG